MAIAEPGETIGVSTGSDNNTAPPLAERRPKTRKRVLLTGIITYAEGAHSFDCTIRNLSDTGARIGVGKNMPFPSEFHIINIRDRIAYDAKLIWNKGGEIGVTFKKATPLSAISDPSLAFLKRLWMAKAAR